MGPAAAIFGVIAFFFVLIFFHWDMLHSPVSNTLPSLQVLLLMVGFLPYIDNFARFAIQFRTRPLHTDLHGKNWNILNFLNVYSGRNTNIRQWQEGNGSEDHSSSNWYYIHPTSVCVFLCLVC